MSDIAKWGLLVAGALALIALILALPFMDFLNVNELSSAITTIVDVAGDSLYCARGIINNLLSPFGRTCVSGLVLYWFTKWIITSGIKLTTWIYHFIFK